MKKILATTIALSALATGSVFAAESAYFHLFNDSNKETVLVHASAYKTMKAAENSKKVGVAGSQGSVLNDYDNYPYFLNAYDLSENRAGFRVELNARYDDMVVVDSGEYSICGTKDQTKRLLSTDSSIYNDYCGDGKGGKSSKGKGKKSR